MSGFRCALLCAGLALGLFGLVAGHQHRCLTFAREGIVQQVGHVVVTPGSRLTAEHHADQATSVTHGRCRQIEA